MCITPIKVRKKDGKDSYHVMVGCRTCWQCRANYVNDWVGRCMAETKTALHTHAVTLTYGRDEFGNENHPRAVVLTYSDVQKFFKSLRKAGFEFSYFAVGEYGSAKGRAHWHVMIFWRNEPPEIERLNKRIDFKYWGHGYSYWEKPGRKAIKYVCKYLNKGLGGDKRQGHLSMSKKPPLGTEYFRRKAADYVRQGLAPQSPEYRIDGVDYWLTGRSLDMFCESFVRQWHESGRGQMPTSDFIDEYLDGLAGVQDVQRKPREVGRRYVRPHEMRIPKIFNEKPEIHFCEIRRCFYYLGLSGDRFYWSMDGEGIYEWQKNVIATKPLAN